MDTSSKLIVIIGSTKLSMALMQGEPDILHLPAHSAREVVRRVLPGFLTDFD